MALSKETIKEILKESPFCADNTKTHVSQIVADTKTRPETKPEKVLFKNGRPA